MNSRRFTIGCIGCDGRRYLRGRIGSVEGEGVEKGAEKPRLVTPGTLAPRVSEEQAPDETSTNIGGGARIRARKVGLSAKGR